MKLFILLFCSVGWMAAAFAAPEGRQELALDREWKFHFGAVAGVERRDFDDTSWETVVLPHTWNHHNSREDRSYARGPGWYRYRFVVEKSLRDRKIFIEFDGANRSTEVFLNGKRLGAHVGGFARFRFDLGDAIDLDGENILAVKVDNTVDGTPPTSADFTFFGGIYRPVRLLAVDPLHVDLTDLGASGVYLSQKKVTATQAELSLEVKLANDSGRQGSVLVRSRLIDTAGKVVAQAEHRESLEAGAKASIVQSLTVTSPHLWQGRRDPFMYTLSVELEKQPSQICDTVDQSIGLRSFAVDPDKGFSLNSQPLDLRGVCRHQDRAGKGWALDAEDEREDMDIIMEMGANAVRTSHYQQSPAWYDLADHRGIVLWTEIPFVNEAQDTPAFIANAEQQLRELIRQNFNHPAICFWGVGNETREPSETSGHEQVNGPVADKIIARLNDVAHAEDPTRLTTYASNHKPEDRKNFHTDVVSFNKYIGWYGGKADNFAAWVDDVHRRYPQLRFGLSEYGAGANIHQHDAGDVAPKPGGPWHSEEYQAHFHEIYWLALKTRPFIWGKFIWNIFDFVSERRTEGGNDGFNDKGLVTYDRKIRKDAFYWYKANWSDQPFVYITGRRYTPRPAGPADIKIYSNTAEVELFVDGVSMGKKASDDHLFLWRGVPLGAGQRKVSVRAIAASGATLDDGCSWEISELSKNK